MCRHAVLLVLACFFSTVVSQCTLPSDLIGTWLTNDNTNIIISNNTIQNYPVGSFGTDTLDCDQVYGDRYILKSQNTYAIAGLTTRAYFCFDFTQVNANLYYYYLASNDTYGYQTLFGVIWTVPTAADICTKSSSQYEVSRFYVLVKDGDGEAAKTSCPTDLEKYWDYGIDSGSGNTCSVTSGLLDGCTDDQFTTNYTICASQVFYSAAGVVYCLNSLTSGSTNYLMVYNSDATVDGTTTYRMACLVYEVSTNTIQMTQYPKQCETGQTPTSVTTPTGSLITFTGATSCPTPPEPEPIVLYAVLGTIGGLVVLFVLGLIIFMLFTWKGKKKPLRGRLEPRKPQPRTPRLQAIENGFRKQPKDAGKDLEKALSREESPEQDEDAPINVMQLLRKDIITPGGRDSPASNVLLSVTTPNPYSQHDGDSISGGTTSARSDGSPFKKHYHVIGSEPSIGGLEEEAEESFGEADGTINTARVGINKPITPRAPMMVMPVQAEGSDLFEGEGGGADDSENDESGMYDVDGQSTLVAARQGVGIHEPMCPPSRLPPIDEGPASHRSYAGSGNKNNNRRNNGNGHTSTTSSFTDQNPTILEKEDLHPERDHLSGTPDYPLPHEPHYPHHHYPSSNHDLSSRPSSRSETPSGRRSSLGMVYKMEGNVMVAINDLVDQVETGSGIAGKKEGGERKVPDMKGRKPDGVRLKPLVRSAGMARRGSGSLSAVKAASALQESKKKRGYGRSKGDKGRHSEMNFADDEEFKPKARVKVTRVDIPELLPPGEREARAPGENELLESPGRAYNNAAFDMQEGEPVQDGSDLTPRRAWLEPVRPTEDVWGRVSGLWKLSHDKHT